MQIKISVVIPVYNVEKYIKICVESVINQSMKDIEIILVDDGSSDQSGEIIDSFVEIDERIHVIHNHNKGVSAARNDGLALSKGEFIYIMDSDDYLDSNALETLYGNAIKTGADVVISDHYTFTEDGIQVEHHFFPEEFVTSDRNIIEKIQNMTLHKSYSPYFTNENTGIGIAAPWTKLLKRELITDNNLTFDSYVKGIFDDGLFSLFIFQYANKISYVRKCLYHYRKLQSSLIHRFNKDRIEIDRRVFQRIDDFSKDYDKDKGNGDFKNAFYARIILYMVHSFDVYFFHKENKEKNKKNFDEFKNMLSSDPYKMAIQRVDVKKLTKKSEKIATILGRWHLYLFCWIVFKIRSVYKNN